MKKILCIALALLMLSACSGGGYSNVEDKFQDGKIVIECTEDGEYAGFSDIPLSYTPEEAAADGCYVVVSTLDVEADAPGLIAGRDAWEEFYADSADGRDAFLRVVHYVDDMPYYSDLYYVDGLYYLFEQNHELGLTQSTPRKHLLRLTDTINGREAMIYVIADDTAMTYRDFERAYTSSSLSVIEEWAGKFTWLGFTTYLK